MKRPLPNRILWKVLATTWLVMGSYQALVAGEGRSHVLFLHSYDKAEWTDELMRGYFSVFTLRSPCDFHIEYMDTKKNQSAEYFSRLEALYALKYKSVRFAVVLTSDDHAFHFALDRQDTLFNGAPVVFCGVNDFKPERLKEHPNATGVVECLDLEETLALAMRLRPGTRTIRVINDETETAKTNLAGLQEILAKQYPAVKIELLQQISLEELGRQLGIRRDDAIAYYNAFWKDKEGHPVTPQGLGEVFKRSAIPIFGRSEWMIGRGMLGGKCVTGFHQGAAAAELAAKVMDGTPASQIPVILNSPNKLLFDYVELERFGFSTEDLPTDSIVSNTPHSFYQDHKSMVWSTIAVVSVLSILVALLLKNVAHRRRVEATLRAEQAKLKTVFDQTFQLMGTLDLEGRLLVANRAAMTLVGAKESDVCGQFFWETRWWRHSTELQARIRLAVQEALGGKTVRFLTTIEDTAGKVHHIDFSLKPAVDATGRMCALIPEGRDVTEVQETLRALSESEERFRQLSENIHEVFWLWDVSAQRLLYVSPAFEAVFGRKAEDAYRNVDEWLEAVHPEDRAEVRNRLQTLPDKPWEKEYRVVSSDGEVRWIREKGFPVCDPAGQVVRVAGVAEDITLRRESDAVLRASEERFRSVVQSSPMGIHLYRLHPDGRLVFVGANPAADVILNTNHARFFGKTIEEAFPPLRATEVPERYRQACADGKPWQTEQILYEDDRIKGAFEVRAFQIAPGTMAAMFLDITHRKQTETALRESERRYRSTFEQAPVGIASVGLNGRLLRVNQRYCDILGCQRNEMLNRTADELIHPDDRLRDRKQHDDLRAGTQNTCAAEICLRRKDGASVCVNRTVSLLSDDNGRPQYFVEIIEDITERRALSERLRQSQKLEAIGQLAGGVAHDFNNQLTAIIGYAELLGKANVDQRLKKYAENVVESARKSAGLTRQLLAFARKGNYESVNLDVHELIEQVIDMLERSIDKRIRIVRVLRARDSQVTGDPAMLQNAILNLALNARDAMPEGGTVTFETEILEPGHGPEWPADLLPGRYLCLRVRDTGMGMSREILERIFEPFFTTKAPGKGTGLGLAAVYGTVNQHQGGLTVSSEPEKGSCFSLFLPLSTKPDEIRTSAAAPERTFKRGRILVVEDEELVRDLTKTLLEELGHTVVLMADGVSGTKHYREHWRSIDLVVLDLIMANMDGRSALEDMRRVNPDVRALLISGFTADVDGLVLPEDDRVGFLQKPFERAALAQIVARMMAGG